MPVDFAFSLDGNNSVPVVRSLPIADSQTLKAGDVVMLTGGAAVKAGNGTGRVLGVMAEDVTTGVGAGRPLRRVFVTTTHQVWTDRATADATSHVFAGRTYDLDANQLVNVADITGGCIQIIALGATTTDVYIQFTACELG